MNYKGLKKIIKAARKSREAASVQAQRDQFFSVLDAELDKVSRFYVKKEEEAKARLAFLRVRGDPPTLMANLLVYPVRRPRSCPDARGRSSRISTRPSSFSNLS